MGAVPPGQGDVAAHAGALLHLAREGGQRTWNLSGKKLVPVVQSGMGWACRPVGWRSAFSAFSFPLGQGAGPAPTTCCLRP